MLIYIYYGRDTLFKLRHSFQGEIPSDWIVLDADSDVLKLECPTNLLGIKEENIVVWVDPLDGTAEYTQGMYLQYIILTLFADTLSITMFII